MIFRSRIKNYKTLMLCGMACLALANIWPRFFHFEASLGTDWVDAIRGFLYGLGIGLNLLTVLLNRRQRQSGCRYR
ncbi:MAG: hypothetical protein QOH25_3556 [Acidobacteriota bacterium]|jgi:hypothetical protein|nr:hypothetical protein [Acidobacteriota bacterium]